MLVSAGQSAVFGTDLSLETAVQKSLVTQARLWLMQPGPALLLLVMPEHLELQLRSHGAAH